MLSKLLSAEFYALKFHVKLLNRFLNGEGKIRMLLAEDPQCFNEFMRAFLRDY